MSVSTTITPISLSEMLKQTIRRLAVFCFECFVAKYGDYQDYIDCYDDKAVKSINSTENSTCMNRV